MVCIDLLGEKSDLPCHSLASGKDRLGLVATSPFGQNLDVPEEQGRKAPSNFADRELLATERCGGIETMDKALHDQLLFDGGNGADSAWVIDREEVQQRNN